MPIFSVYCVFTSHCMVIGSPMTFASVLTFLLAGDYPATSFILYWLLSQDSTNSKTHSVIAAGLHYIASPQTTKTILLSTGLLLLHVQLLCPLPRNSYCLLSHYSAKAVVQLPILQLLPSNKSICHNMIGRTAVLVLWVWSMKYITEIILRGMMYQVSWWSTQALNNITAHYLRNLRSSCV